VKQAAAGRVRPDWPLSVCFRRSGHQQGGPDAVLTDEAGGLAPWRGAENGCRTPAAREFMMIRRKGDLPLRADPETQRVLPPGQGPRWHQDPSSKRNERPAPDPAGARHPPGALAPGWPVARTARRAGAMTPARPQGWRDSVSFVPVTNTCPLQFSARRQSMGAVAGRFDPVVGRVAQTGAIAFGVVLRAPARSTGIGLRAALGR
jgi:hypothetical protein